MIAPITNMIRNFLPQFGNIEEPNMKKTKIFIYFCCILLFMGCTSHMIKEPFLKKEGLLQNQQNLDKRSSCLHKKENELKQKAKKIEKEKEWLQKRYKSLVAMKEALNEKAKRLSQKNMDLNKKEQSLLQKEAYLAEQRQDLIKKNQYLAFKENEINKLVLKHKFRGLVAIATENDENSFDNYPHENDSLFQYVVGIEIDNAVQGRGFIIDKDKVLTCYHILKASNKKEVLIKVNGTTIKASFVDRENDIALLKLETPLKYKFNEFGIGRTQTKLSNVDIFDFYKHNKVLFHDSLEKVPFMIIQGQPIKDVYLAKQKIIRPGDSGSPCFYSQNGRFYLCSLVIGRRTKRYGSKAIISNPQDLQKLLERNLSN